MSRSISLLWSFAAVASLAGCSGGSSSPPPPSPPPVGVSLTGTAQSALALGGATIDAKCNGSTGTATAGSNGIYTLSIATGNLPCVLRASSGGTVLHAVVNSGGTAHITPATELIVADLAGTTAAAYYASYDAAAAAALTDARVTASQARVVDTLTKSGANFATAGNPISAPLTAGGAYAQALTALQTGLTNASLTLDQFAATVVRNSPSNLVAPTGAVTLPPQVLLQPADANCPALRSGTYRLVIPLPASPGEYATETFVLNAVTREILNQAGDTGTYTSAGNCRFGDANGGFVVSQAGVVVMRSQEEGAMRLGIAFPEQTHAVADLAGNWGSLGYERADNGSYGTDALLSTVTAAGALTDASYCENVITCMPLSGFNISLSTNTAGGFNFTHTTENWTDRAFAYRSGGGDLMLVVLAGNGSFSLWAKAQPFTPPVVGTWQRSWGAWTATNLQSTTDFSVSDFDVDSNTATTWTRSSRTDGHVETITANDPRPGWLSRPESNAPITGGGTVLVRGYHGLFLRGMGLSALSMPSLGGGAYFLSVNRP